MVGADGTGQQQAVAETDAARVEQNTVAAVEWEKQDAYDAVRGEVSSRGGGSRGEGSRGGGSRGGGSRGAGAWVGGGGGVGDGGAESKLEDEAAVGSIHHILKTAFKEFYGGGGDVEKETKEQDSAAVAAGKRPGGSAGGSGSESGRRSSVSPAGTTRGEGRTSR